MMIFVTTTDALTDEKLYEKAYSLIPEYRKTKADKMKMRENKLQTVTAGLLLNYVVGKWSIKTEERDYKTDENLYEKVDIIRKENLIFCQIVKFFSIFHIRLIM